MRFSFALLSHFCQIYVANKMVILPERVKSEKTVEKYFLNFKEKI